MQDYFKSNKNQQGTSLFMKSDSDGVKDGQNKVMPLGIKTTAQGIEHFTNWESIANSIEAKNFARFDDAQPTSLNFSTMEQVPKNNGISFQDIIGRPTDIAKGRRTVEFTDTWTPNDIKILDDIAFVAQDEYTDIHRKDFDLGVVGLKQYVGINTVTPGAGTDSGGADDSSNVAKWTLNGTWGSNFEGSSPSGVIIITYAPLTSTWTFSATVPNTGGWGGTITGTKVQNACSCTGGGCSSTSVSIPISGTHYCGFTGGSASYSGLFNITYTPSSNSGATCASDISSIGSYTLNYLAGGGCSLSFSVSSTVYDGFVSSGGGSGESDSDPGNNSIITSIRRLGTLNFRTQNIFSFVQDQVYRENVDEEASDETKHVFTSDFNSYSNFILKMQPNKTVNTVLGYNQRLPDNMYFLFGGVVKGDAEFVNSSGNEFKIPYLNDSNISHDNLARPEDETRPRSVLSSCESKKFRDWNQFGSPVKTAENSIFPSSFGNAPDLTSANDLVVGYYYVVVETDTDSINKDRLINTSSTGEVGIQLSIQSNWGQSPEFEGVYDLLQHFDIETPNIAYSTLAANCKFMKFQPVRKCGKVDIYTRKTGIISSAVNNSLTSSNHNLNTNDVIKISSAVFDGSQNGTADIHPLNGNKFVKKVDDNTFEVYDDQYFKDPTSTLNLKTTDGITWTCISNNFGSLGQSWDYYGSMFSPTGRNGYSHVDEAVSSFLAPKNSFFTEKRIKKGVEESDDFADEIASKSINVNFGKIGLYSSGNEGSYGPLGAWLNSRFAKDLEENIPVTFSEDYQTPLDDPSRGLQDFFPYNCQDDLSNFVDPSPSKEGEDIKSPYPGMRFGSSMDLKFSHNSGSSKVYTLAVGERGSDVSVDLFGVVPSEQLFGKASMVWDGENLTQSFRKKILPYYLPYGRTHFISITVDQFGRITDLSHQDTVFGGGHSISNYGQDDTVGIEMNPWTDFESLYRAAEYKNLCKPTGPINTFDIFQDITSFNEKSTSNHFPRRSSRYWTRAALLHWKGQDIYNRNSRVDPSKLSTTEVLDRNIKADRSVKKSSKRLFDVFGASGENFDGEEVFTRFGEGSGLDMIDRFAGVTDDPFQFRGTIQYWAIFPWVDSFGKAVAIHNDASLSLGDLSPTTYPESNPKTVILSASRVRSNIDINNNTEQPVLAEDANLTREDTVSEIGQITAHFLYKDNSNVYRNVDYIPFNSGGSSSGRFAIDEPVLISNGIEFSKLPTGTSGGIGMSEVITSAELSCSKILWEEDYIVWSEQDLFNSNSIIHLFTFDGKFKPSKSISKPFAQARTSTFPSPATYVGEGFGLDFRYEDRLFIGNALEDTDEGGNLIAGVSGIEGHFIDQLFVYEMLRNRSTFELSQRILPAIDESREDYYSEYFKSPDYNFPHLLKLKNAFNYDNNPLSTSVWDIDLTNRYDLAGKKIVLKDALEYSVFDRDYSQNEKFSISEPYDARVPIYLGISEDTSIQRLKSTSSISYNYISQSTTEYDCANSGGEISQYRSNKTPFFFLNIPLDSLDMAEDVTINFDILEEDIFSTFETVRNSEDTNNIIPRLVLYGKDPRSTVIENGPATNGSDLVNYPRYENGLWSRPRFDAGPDLEYYSDMYPGYYRGGAQDLFFYGRIPGSFIKTGKVDFPERQTLPYLYGGNINLGEYYDLTAGSRGGGGAGDPAWIAPDVYQDLNPSEINHILPYAKIFLPTASADGYSVTISAQDIRDFVIKGSLTKDAANNRPTTVAGTFNDTSNLYDGAGEINYTLAIGFVLTNVNSFNFVTGQTQHEEPSLKFNVGPLRYIHQSNFNNKNFPDARYPYAFDVNFYQPTLNGAEVEYTDLGLDQLNYELRAKVRNLDASISKKRLISRRYRNSFHKIAVFNYNQEARDDVRRIYIDGSDAKVYDAFGVNNLVPVPEENRLPVFGSTSDNEERLNTVKSNPIIRIGKSSASSDSASVKDGSFSKSLQIINTDSIYYTNMTGGASNIYLNQDDGTLNYVAPPTGHVIGKSFFGVNTLFGGFDIQSPEYLNLFINSNPTAENGAELTMPKIHEVINNNINLFSNGFTTLNNAASLWTGVHEEDEVNTLFLRALLDNKQMSLFTFEVAPSAVATLFTDGPDVTGDITLTIAPPVTASGNLFTVGPTLNTGAIPLNIQSHANISDAFRLSVSGVFAATGAAPLYSVASVPENKFTTLAMNPVNSGAIPLFIVKHPEATGVMNLSIASKASGLQEFNLFTGNQFDVHERFTDLFIKSQQFASGEMTLFNEGFLDTANSNRDTNTSVAASLIDEVFDRGGVFGKGKEDPIKKTLGARSYESNSVVCGTINESIYSKNRMTYDPSSRGGLWFMSSSLRSPAIINGLETRDPALINSTLGVENLVRPFYKDNNKQSVVDATNSTINKDAYDINDDYLVKSCISSDEIQIDMYTVNEDGTVSQQGERNRNGIIRFRPGASTAENNEVIGGSLDPFHSLRSQILDQVNTIHQKEFVGADIIDQSAEVSINDLKLSSNNKCAVSFRLRVGYKKDLVEYYSNFNVILIFRVTGYKDVESGFDSSDDFNFLIFQESGEDVDKQNSGYNVAFDYQDVYFDRRGISEGSDGEIWRSLASDGYSVSERVVKFSDLTDANHYSTNSAFINSGQKNTGFGYPLKIFNEHNTNNKIMLVGATLFDPYIFNTLDDSHAPNAMGAVYIYKKSAASETWTYHGAVYSKGFTSDNVLSNLSSYRGGKLSTRQSALFGYDFDYNQDILVVSEPGGDGTEVVNAGKAYAFDISSTPTLVKSYEASDVSLPDGTNISSGDNFGSNVLILGKEDVLSWSDATLSQDIDLGFNRYQNDSTIYNLRNNSVFGFSYEDSEGVLSFVADSVKSEIDPYNAGGLGNFSEDNIYRWARIVSMKKFRSRSQDKLLVVREFSLKLKSGNPSDVAEKSIRVQKLSVLNLDRSPNGTLFIKGPFEHNNLAPLYNLGLGPSGLAPLVMKPPLIDCSGIAPLFVNNLAFNQKMSLMTERVDNPYLTLNIDGIVSNIDAQADLFVRNQEVNNNVTLVTIPSADSENALASTFVQGSNAISEVADTTLFIGQEINANNLASLYLQTWPKGTNFTPGSLIDQQTTSLSVSGMFENAFADPQLGGVNFYLNAPDKASGVGFMTNVVKTEIPVIGTGGSFVESGVISMVLTGNNPANVFTKINQDASLVIASNVIQSGVVPIFMQRPFANAASLFIDSRISSGVQDLYVDGANIANSGMNLITKTPESNNFNIFTRGFKE